MVKYLAVYHDQDEGVAALIQAPMIIMLQLATPEQTQSSTTSKIGGS